MLLSALTFVLMCLFISVYLSSILARRSLVHPTRVVACRRVLCVLCVSTVCSLPPFPDVLRHFYFFSPNLHFPSTLHLSVKSAEIQFHFTFTLSYIPPSPSIPAPSLARCLYSYSPCRARTHARTHTPVVCSIHTSIFCLSSYSLHRIRTVLTPTVSLSLFLSSCAL